MIVAEFEKMTCDGQCTRNLGDAFDIRDICGY
jgi:hypothetical protein